MAQLRLVKPAAAPSVVTHKNRMGDTYYLHEGKTKTGKARYFFAKSVRDGALAEMPPGLEVSESLNGVVSVRRVTAGAVVVPDADVKLVEAAVGWQAHLRGYVVRTIGKAIVIFEPDAHPTSKAQYSPVLKFERQGTGYAVHRMTYRGDGGWSWPLMDGKLADLAKKVVAKIGTDDFFELI